MLLFLNASTQRHEVLTKRSRSSVRELCSQNVIAKFALRLMFSPLVCEMCLHLFIFIIKGQKAEDFVYDTH